MLSSQINLTRAYFQSTASMPGPVTSLAGTRLEVHSGVFIGNDDQSIVFDTGSNTGRFSLTPGVYSLEGSTKPFFTNNVAFTRFTYRFKDLDKNVFIGTTGSAHANAYSMSSITKAIVIVSGSTTSSFELQTFQVVSATNVLQEIFNTKISITKLSQFYPYKDFFHAQSRDSYTFSTQDFVYRFSETLYNSDKIISSLNGTAFTIPKGVWELEAQCGITGAGTTIFGNFGFTPTGSFQFFGSTGFTREIGAATNDGYGCFAYAVLEVTESLTFQVRIQGTPGSCGLGSYIFIKKIR